MVLPLADRSETSLELAASAIAGGGEQRPGQTEMLRAVAEAIESEKHLIVQAGTGTGKSLAYLIPVVLSGQRTVIATATKALQDQIADHELPHLAKTLNHNFDWAVLKGRSNYICRQRINELSRDRQGSLDGLAVADDDEVDRLIEFADMSDTGDRAELDFEPSDAAWSAVSVTSRECPGRSKCPSGSNCVVEMARDRAAESDVIVVNTHLLGMDMLSESGFLPEHKVVIVDEAHQLEDIASSTFGWSISGARLRWFARVVGRILVGDTEKDALIKRGDAISDVIDPLVGQKITPGSNKELDAALDLARDKVSDTLDTLRNLPKGRNADADARAARAVKAGEALLVDVTRTIVLDRGHVAWVERAGGEAALQVAPIDVSSVLGPALFGERTAVLTSATLSPAIAQAVGLTGEDYLHLEVESPFDYKAHGLLYCASYLPEPRSQNYEPAMLSHLCELIEAAGGRTLSLFTSWRMMERAADHLRSNLELPILTQRDLPKPALIEKFSESPETSLLATMGFWQGIDVPGPSLTLVTIDRLPFPRPDDPLLSARRDLAGPAAFRTIDLPRAATLLAQGAGRLIRRSSDRGVVAVLDSRLATKKSYRWELINAMPDFDRTGDAATALARLRQLAEEANEPVGGSA